MNPNLTNLSKVSEGEVSLDDINLEIKKRYMPTMEKVALISKIEKYIMELRLNAEGISPSSLPAVSNSILVYHIAEYYTNISTRTVTNNPDNFIIKAMELSDVIQSSGVINVLLDEIEDVRSLYDMVNKINDNATGLYGIVYYAMLGQKADFDVSEIGEYLTEENIEKIGNIIKSLN